MLQHSILKDLVAFALRQVNKDPMEAWGPTIPYPRFVCSFIIYVNQVENAVCS